MTFDVYSSAIEELALSGAVSLVNCSKSTAYRWRKEINERLEWDKSCWRVKVDYNPVDDIYCLIAIESN